MHEQNANVGAKNGRRSASTARVREPLSDRAIDFGRSIWRPAGTLVAFALALLLTWHVVNGKHGLNVWLQKRAEDRQLQRDIQDLQQENASLRNRIEHLKSDPDTIMIEARQKLHYAKPDEVIVTLPPVNGSPSQPASPAADPKK
jgi:cell division protein FtsB